MKAPFYEQDVSGDLFDALDLGFTIKRAIAEKGRDHDWVVVTFTPDVDTKTVKITLTDKEKL